MHDHTDPLDAFHASAALTDAIDGIDDDSCDFDEISELSLDIAAWSPGDLPCRNHLARRLASLLVGAATFADETLAHTLRERAEAWRQTTARLIDAVARPAATVIGFLAAAFQRAGEGSPAR